MEKWRLSRRDFCKLLLLAPLALEGSTVPRYRELYTRYGAEVSPLCDPPSKEEMLTFALATQRQTQALFEKRVTQANTADLFIRSIQTQGQEGRSSMGFVFARTPLEQSKHGLLYFHSLACPSFDFSYWNDGFEDLLNNGYAIAMAVGNQCSAHVGDATVTTGGLITDNAHTDALRLVSSAIEDTPHLQDIPWDVTGISMGGSAGYSTMQWWNEFATHYPLPKQLEQIALYSPYAKLLNPLLLEKTISTDQMHEEAGLELAMKWAIQDTGEKIRLMRHDHREGDGMLPIEHLIGLRPAEQSLFRQRVLYASPAYHTHARRLLGNAPVMAPYRISYSRFDQVVPPDETKELFRTLIQEPLAAELVELPGFHGMIPNAKALLKEVMGNSVNS